MAKSPLFHPRVLAVERKLDVGELNEAQHLLAALGEDDRFRHAVTYLAIRLRYLRGRLSPAEVAERLSALLAEVGEFPEAHALLETAQAGGLKTKPPVPTVAPSFFAAKKTAPASVEHLPEIPKAAALPRMTPPEKREPKREQRKPDRNRESGIPSLEVAGGSRPPPGFSAHVGENWEEPPPPQEPVRRASYSEAPNEVVAVPRRPSSMPPPRRASSPPPAEVRSARPSRPPPPPSESSARHRVGRATARCQRCPFFVRDCRAPRCGRHRWGAPRSRARRRLRIRSSAHGSARVHPSRARRRSPRPHPAPCPSSPRGAGNSSHGSSPGPGARRPQSRSGPSKARVLR